MSTQSTTDYSASVRAVASSQRLATYERVSGERQEKEETIENQTMALDAAVAACGGRIVERYRDEPYTGTVAHRPALDRLMRDAGKTFTHLLIYDTHRLARGKPHLRPMLEDELREKGVTFAYLKYEVEDSPGGRAKDGMTNVFNEWEREQIVGRMEAGKARKRTNGFIWRGRRPTGWIYRKPGEGERHGHLEHHPEEAPLVREIIERVAGGMTCGALADDLNRRGLRTARGNAWTALAVLQVVHNPLHSGRIVLDRYQAAKPAPERKRVEYAKAGPRSSARLRPRAEWGAPDPLLVERNGVAIEPIVTPELQDQAERALLANRRFSKGHARQVYLLRGLVYCIAPRLDRPDEPCGRKMAVRRRSRRPSHEYFCPQTYPLGTASRKKCGRSIGGRKLEDAVWAHLERMAEEPEKLRLQFESTREGDRAERDRAERAVARAKETCDRITAQIDALLLSRATVDAEDFGRVYGRLREERAQAQAALAEATAYRRGLDGAAVEWEAVAAYLRDLRTVLRIVRQPGHEEQAVRVLRAVIQRISYDGCDWWIAWRYGGRERVSFEHLISGR